MPWEPRDVIAMREEFVRLAQQPGANRRELMRRFNISPTVAYKWIRRFSDEGVDGLHDRSRKPKSSPGKTSAAMERIILALRDEFPFWGGRKLAHIMKGRGVDGVPSISTVTEILRRNGRLAKGPGERRDFQRFEHANPNDLWQMDFKGDFLMSDQRRCYPLTVCDDHSRFNLVLAACLDMRTGTVKRHLGRAFGRYGTPAAILCDNGSPWGSNFSKGSFTQLEVWLMSLGIKVIHGRPYHPQTQGKEERFHRTLKVEVLDYLQDIRDLGDAERAFGEFRDRFNNVRPHEALGMDVPANRYRASARKMDIRGVAEGDWMVDDGNARKVQRSGQLHFQGKELQIGEGLRGRKVELRRLGDGIWEAWFGVNMIGVYDLTKPPTLKNRYARLTREEAFKLSRKKT